MLGLQIRRVLLAAAALGLLVATSGCLRLDLSLQVRPDDTVGGAFTAAWSDEFAEQAADEGMDQAQLDALLDALLDGVPGTERVPYAEDGYSGYTATFTDWPLTDFSEFGGDDWGFLRINHSGRDYTLESHWDLRAGGFLDPAAFEDAEIRLSVDFPARVTEHNGTLEGRTVTWTMTPGEEYDLTATAVENSGLAFLITGIAFTLVVCGLLWLWQWRRLRRHSVGNPSA